MSEGIGRDEPPIVKALFRPGGTPASDAIGIGIGWPAGAMTVKAFCAEAGRATALAGIIITGAPGVIAAAAHDEAPGVALGSGLGFGMGVVAGDHGEPGTGRRMPVMRDHRPPSLGAAAGRASATLLLTTSRRGGGSGFFASVLAASAASVRDG